MLVTNKGKHSKSHFIIAKDEDDAKRIAATESGTPVRVTEMPQTDGNISKLCQGTTTGILAKKIVAYRMDEVLGLKPKPAQPVDPWFFIKEV